MCGPCSYRLQAYVCVQGVHRESGGGSMRVDLPGCGFRYCRYNAEGNCTKKTLYETCEYQRLKQKEIEDGHPAIKYDFDPV